MSQWTVNNLVISAQLNEQLTFSNIRMSNHEMCYEPELFPAALISRWLPVHVAVFHNGKVIITGLKTEKQANSILDSLIDYVRTQKIVK